MDAVQFWTVVMAVEIGETTAKKIRECGAKEMQPTLIIIAVKGLNPGVISKVG